MASVKLISEEEAEGKVREVYEDIKGTLRIDFVPNMYKAMAGKPSFLEANWKKVKAVMVEPGKARPDDEGDNCSSSICGNGVRVLTKRPYFCGAEAGAR